MSGEAPGLINIFIFICVTQVFKNLKLFMQNKQDGDDLFDRLNVSIKPPPFLILLPFLQCQGALGVRSEADSVLNQTKVRISILSFEVRSEYML